MTVSISPQRSTNYKELLFKELKTLGFAHIEFRSFTIIRIIDPEDVYEILDQVDRLIIPHEMRLELLRESKTLFGNQVEIRLYSCKGGM